MIFWPPDVNPVYGRTVTVAENVGSAKGASRVCPKAPWMHASAGFPEAGPATRTVRTFPLASNRMVARDAASLGRRHARALGNVDASAL